MLQKSLQRVCEKIILNDDHVGDQKLTELLRSISTSTSMRELYIYKDAKLNVLDLNQKHWGNEHEQF